jgi:DnaK suppressor protein
MLTEKEMQRFRRDLERQRKQLLARAKNLGWSVNPADERDTEDADIIVHIQTREQELWAKDELQKRLSETDHALKRIEEGTYGQCESCGIDIDHDRLIILPETTMCVRCREEADRRAQLATWGAEENESDESDSEEEEEEVVEETEEVEDEDEEEEEEELTEGLEEVPLSEDIEEEPFIIQGEDEK